MSLRTSRFPSPPQKSAQASTSVLGTCHLQTAWNWQFAPAKIAPSQKETIVLPTSNASNIFNCLVILFQVRYATSFRCLAVFCDPANYAGQKYEHSPLGLRRLTWFVNSGFVGWKAPQIGVAWGHVGKGSTSSLPTPRVLASWSLDKEGALLAEKCHVMLKHHLFFFGGRLNNAQMNQSKIRLF